MAHKRHPAGRNAGGPGLQAGTLGAVAGDEQPGRGHPPNRGNQRIDALFRDQAAKKNSGPSERWLAPPQAAAKSRSNAVKSRKLG